MSLRTRLLLGYSYLVLLILLTAGGAGVAVFKLSNGIGDVVRNNFHSVSAASDMVGALSQQNNATLQFLTHPESRDLSQQTLSEAQAEFDIAFNEAEGNVTVPGEAARIEEIRQAYKAYEASRDILLSAQPDDPFDAYDRHISQNSRVVRGHIFDLLDLNQEAIVKADERARSTATQNGIGLGIVVTLALISLIALSRALQQHILLRLAEFKDISEAIAAGEVNRRYKESDDDELGILAQNLNTGIDAQKQLRTQAQGRLSQQRQLLLGALSQRKEGVALLGIDGLLAASTLEGEAVRALEAHRDWILKGGRELMRAYESGDPPPTHRIEFSPECTLIFELLVAQKSRPVGWLVREDLASKPPIV